MARRASPFSKDKGLRPLLKFFAHLFNEHIVHEIYPDLFFEWVGIDAMSEKDKIELTTKKLTNGILTINEVRAMEDLDPVKANWANAPGNATLMQVYVADMSYQRQKEAEAAQAAQAALPQPGMPPGGAPGGAPGMPPGGEMPPGGAPGMPPAAPGAAPAGPEGAQGGAPAAPELPGGPGGPKELREPRPEEAGIEMPVPTRSKKEKGTGEYEAARENEKKQGAAKREEKHIGMNVNKSQEGDDVVLEFEIE